MTLDDQQRVVNNGATRGSTDSKGGQSYSSTASTSCHTPLSVSSSTSSECLNLSPKRHGGSDGGGGCASTSSGAGNKRPRSVLTLGESDSGGDDDSGSNSRYRLRRRRRTALANGASGTPLEDSCSTPTVDVSKMLQ